MPPTVRAPISGRNDFDLSGTRTLHKEQSSANHLGWHSRATRGVIVGAAWILLSLRLLKTDPRLAPGRRPVGF